MSVDEESQDWAAEEVFDLYVQYRGEQNILHNVHCDHGASIFKFQYAGAEIIIKQNRDLQSGLGVTGAAVWDGSIVLARYLEACGKGLGLTAASRCVELGAGTGLLGIALNVGLGIRDVWVTDKDEMLKLLAQNVAANESTAKVRELVWGCDRPLDGIGGADFVLAADCIYHDSLVPPFVDTLVSLAHDAAVVLVAFELRDSDVIECFFAHAHAHFNLERLDTTVLHTRHGPDGVAIYRLHPRLKTLSACVDDL